MDWEIYCKTLEKNLNEKWREIHELEDKVKYLEDLINNASSKLEEYYQQQKDNEYLSNEGRRLICRVIENCQKIVQGTFKAKENGCMEFLGVENVERLKNEITDVIIQQVINDLHDDYDYP